MIGYCAIGSCGIAMAPKRQMKSATTQAKIGLSMKKLAMSIYSGTRLSGFLPLGRKARSGIRISPGGRLDLVACSKFLEALDHDALAALQAFGHEPLTVLHGTRSYHLDRNMTVILDDEYFGAAAAIALHCLLRNGNGMSVSMPCSICTRTYMPGNSSRFGFGNSPRSVT